MKLCITSSSLTLESPIDPRFSRCLYFLIVDSDDLSFNVFNNPAASAMGQAGVKATRFITNKGVNILITGNIGPKAFNAINAAGIKVYTHVAGTVKEVIELYKSGKLKELTQPNVRLHQGRKDFGVGGFGRRT